MYLKEMPQAAREVVAHSQVLAVTVVEKDKVSSTDTLQK